MNINNPTTFGTPSLTLSTSNSSGTGGALRSDDTILVYDTTVPTTIASGASAATGDTATAARRNHTHGMGTLVTQSSEAALIAETDEDTYAPPDRIKYSPGVAKVWCDWETLGAHAIVAAYNMTSVTDGGALGDSDVLYNIDFAAGSYAGGGLANTDQLVGISGGTKAAGGAQIVVITANSGAGVDTDDASMALYGTQA